MEENRKIEELLDLQEQDLLIIIGDYVLGRSALPPPPKALIAAAIKWLDARRDIFAQVICSSEQIQELSRSDGGGGRRADIAAAIADVIITVNKGMPVAVISVLLAKEGIHTFCRKYWE